MASAVELEKPGFAYRPDIDGLRAVAVLVVLGYHLDVSWLGGGFVGVDVFFVISGYLISAIILKDIEAGRFTVAGFYERRIRRIMPALLVTLLGTFALGLIFLLPTEMLDFGHSLMTAALSVSNVFFWLKSGYFDAPALSKPLLHTWSLAVEEQFYLLFPLFLLLVRRRGGGRLRTAVVVAALVSFAASVIGLRPWPTATFYLVHSRAWELLLGAMLAMRLFPPIRSAKGRHASSVLGLGLVLIAAHWFSDSTRFPGAAALLPCVGTALVIAAGQEGPSLVGRLLSWKPVVFIGLISYSLYLWHWPLIVFHGLDPLFPLSYSPKTVKLLLLGTSFVMAILSWRFVERPFRHGRAKRRGPIVFGAAALGTGATLALAFAIMAGNGFPRRWAPVADQIGDYLEARTPDREGTCFITSRQEFTDYNPSICLKADATKKNYLLVGDSHAAHLWYGLNATLGGVNVMQANASGCLPVLDRRPNDAVRCVRMMDLVFSDYLPSHHVDKLLLSARWDAAVLPALDRTLDWAKTRGIEVVLFGPIPQYDMALPRLLAYSWKYKDWNLADRHRVDTYANLDQMMEDRAGAAWAQPDWKVRYISLFDVLCNHQSCIEYADGHVPLQRDYGHLTQEGSLAVAKRLRERLPPF
jgi:peptidoglycan/LPS O-acetylase OafA/YrhL